MKMSRGQLNDLNPSDMYTKQTSVNETSRGQLNELNPSDGSNSNKHLTKEDTRARVPGSGSYPGELN